MTNASERIKWWRPPTLQGVDILLAENCARRWAVFHETYTVCTCVDFGDAEIEWRYRRKIHHARSGTMMLMEPGEVHANTHITPPIGFRVLLIDPSLVHAAAAELGRTLIPPQWKSALTQHPLLLRQLCALHESLERTTTPLESESRLVTCLRLLLEHCSENGLPAFKQPARALLSRARDFIREHYNEAITLSQLSAISGLSRFHLVRAFAKEFALTPHAYQVNVQAAKARMLLLAGHLPAEAAAETGFADQSHLTRHFKRVYGVTPGRYKKDR
jgi:AraC-like DNA-binding protein